MNIERSNIIRNYSDGTSTTITASSLDFIERNTIGRSEVNSRTLLLPAKHKPMFNIKRLLVNKVSQMNI
jgi:hypothetical protein